MRTRSLLALVVGYPLLGGCVQGPPLQYTAFPDGGGAPQADYAGLTKFTLARSLLLVEAAGGRAARVTSVPAEATGNDTDFGIREAPGNNGLTLQMTKVGNSNLVRSVALHASSGQAMAPVPDSQGATGPRASEAVNLPGLALAIDTQSLLDTARPGRVVMAGLAEGEGKQLAFDIVFDPIPTDAIETRHLDLQRTGNLYFYSACRTATLTFLTPPLAQQRFSVIVADPNFIQTVAIGKDRTIASHTACGVDVIAGDVESAGQAITMARLVAQARSLSTSWTTRPMADSAQALAAVKPVAAAKRRVARPRRAIAASTPASAPPPVEAATSSAPTGNPLRNAEIRLPVPGPRESFAF